jgi:hypothetical protein
MTASTNPLPRRTRIFRAYRRATLEQFLLVLAIASRNAQEAVHG